jgi:hypothetical protein
VLLRQAAERRESGGAGICENDIDASHLLLDLAVEAVEVGRLGDVALDGRRARSEKRGGRFEFRLPYSGARGFSGALGFSAMLRYAVAGQDNALGSSVATLSTNCDAGPVLQFALIVGASATPTPTR